MIPDPSKAYLAHQYWALTFKAAKTKHDLTSALAKLEQCIGPNYFWRTRNPFQPTYTRLKNIWNRQNTMPMSYVRCTWLHYWTMLWQPEETHKELTYLIRAEHNRQCYIYFHQHTKPKSPGGLAYVTICNENDQTQLLLNKKSWKQHSLNIATCTLHKQMGLLSLLNPWAASCNTMVWHHTVTFSPNAIQYSDFTTSMKPCKQYSIISAKTTQQPTWTMRYLWMESGNGWSAPRCLLLVTT